MSEFWDKWVEYVLLHHRWLFVTFFLLPISVIYEIFIAARNWLIFKLNTAPLQHESRVLDIQRQIKEWRKNASHQKMCTARPGWQTMSFRQALYKTSMYNIRINLYDILKIDTEQKYVRVEPLVTMGQLSKALHSLGWTIPVVPELDDLTVGGLIMGTGVESSSHKYGLFGQICRSFELVMCDGSVVKCSREENSELFHAIPWSHGTIGFLVSAEIDIIPAKELVKLHYQPVYSLQQAAKTFSDASKDHSNDFVEGLMFSKDTGVIMTGKMVDKDDSTEVNAIGCWYKPWFFKHVESKLDKSNKVMTEFIPLRDYYHRHSRSLFWELQDIVPFGNNLLFRWLLGWTMPPKISLLKLTQSKQIKKFYETSHMVQDFLIPIEKLEEAISLIDKTVKIYPLWLCPFVLTPETGFVHSSKLGNAMFADVGVYGTPHTDDFDAVRTTKSLEKFLIDSEGYQMLYADTYTTREEFRKMFDHTHYDKIRKNYECEKGFPEVYDKINKNVRT